MRRSGIALLAGAFVVATAAYAGQAGTEAIGAESRLKPLAAEVFDPNRFSHPAAVDNKWLPLKPGTQFVFMGSSSDGKKRLVFTVTDLVKVVGGVRNVVIWDRDYTDGELVEAELAFFAQDDDGNVWHTGEYPEEYEGGKVVKAPAWLVGVKGARAGFEMKEEPRVGTPSYAQGYAPPPISWTDRAQVYQMGQRTCVPFRCYEDVLITREFNPDEPGRFQLKYYAPGVGNIRVGWSGKDTDRESLALVELVHLSPAALARVRAAALKLEARAYKTKPEVYGRTPPAERLP
jgi:hypothetical protein